MLSPCLTPAVFGTSVFSPPISKEHQQPLVRTLDDAEEVGWDAKLGEHRPEHVARHRVKGLFQIYTEWATLAQDRAKWARLITRKRPHEHPFRITNPCV